MHRLVYTPSQLQVFRRMLARYHPPEQRALRRVLGPSTIVAGAALAWLGEADPPSTLFGAGFLLIGFGVFEIVRPPLLVGLAMLRRGREMASLRGRIQLQLTDEAVEVSTIEGEYRFPLELVTSVESGPAETWIHFGDEGLVFVPRHGLEQGDPESFLGALQERLAARA